MRLLLRGFHPRHFLEDRCRLGYQFESSFDVCFCQVEQIAESEREVLQVYYVVAARRFPDGPEEGLQAGQLSRDGGKFAMNCYGFGVWFSHRPPPLPR